VAFNWGLARVKANLDQRTAERTYGIGEADLTPSLSWSLYGLRKDWNAVKDTVTPWWGGCSTARTVDSCTRRSAPGAFGQVTGPGAVSMTAPEPCSSAPEARVDTSGGLGRGPRPRAGWPGRGPLALGGSRGRPGRLVRPTQRPRAHLRAGRARSHPSHRRRNPRVVPGSFRPGWRGDHPRRAEPSHCQQPPSEHPQPLDRRQHTACPDRPRTARRAHWSR
jgi:hypothetical protein